MECSPRHQCLIYEGSPSRQLPALVAATIEKLQQNKRCLFLNSPTIVVGMRSYLAAAGLDVAEEIARGSLMMTSEQNLGSRYEFDIQTMIDGLNSALDGALADGYSGLWATGDMAWEFGPLKDFSKLLEYEWHLEAFLEANPEMSGICQYRSDMLPRAAMRHGLLSHQGLFVNETLSLVNPQYLRPDQFFDEAEKNPELDSIINKLIGHQVPN